MNPDLDRNLRPRSTGPRRIGPRRIGVVGSGYVGTVTAVALAELGHMVVCLDIDAGKIERLRRGEAPFTEPGLPAILARHRSRLHFTTDPKDVFGVPGRPGASIVFVTVDTPPLASGDADLSRVDAVVAGIPEGAAVTLVMKSTVPVNTGARVQRGLRARGLHGVRYAANPEFLREGSALHDVFAPDRVVVGADDPRVAAEVAAIWEPLGGETLLCDLASAEMIKLASNAFLATKISFVNEIANVCDAVGADVETVALGMGLDRRIGAAFLRPGIGYGGSCFPKDVAALKQLAGNSGYHFQLLSAVIEVNELQKRRVVTTLVARLGPLAGTRIALLGIAFKPNTDDTREAACVVLAERLVAEGVTVVVHDPVVRSIEGCLPAGVVLADSLADAVTGVDAAVVVTEWPEYEALVTPQLVARMARPLVVDGRNLLDPVAARRAGLEWVGIGRPMICATSPPATVARVS